MARGFDKHRERIDALNGLGRILSRRAGAKCELCGASESLKAVEVPPVLEEVDLDRAVMLCARCQAVAEAPDKQKAQELRYLEQSVWTETLPAQLLAVRIVRQLASAGVDWASECADNLYLSEDVEALLA